MLGALACVGAAMLPTGAAVDRTPAADAAVAPVGNGFVVTPGDLMYILKQIKIAERHSRSVLGTEPTQGANPDPTGDPEYCQSLVGSNPDQIPDALTSYGLRTVDGACNNLVKNSAAVPHRDRFGAADQPFPRITTPSFRDAEPITPSFPVGPPGPTSYKQKLAGNVVIDSQPRVISNLIVDQTAKNPAAVAAAGTPVRTQGDTGIFPCGVGETVLITGSATRPFTLSVGGQTTTTILPNAGRAAIQAALSALSSVGAGNVVVTGALGSDLAISFSAAVGNLTPNLAVQSAPITGLTIATTQPFDAATSTPELQTISGSANVPFTLSLGPANTTGELPVDATDAQVQSALEALPAVGAGNVTVTGGQLPAELTMAFAPAVGDPIQLIASATATGLVATTGNEGSALNAPNCTPANQSLFIPNVTTDVGLSPPYNSWFTFFGQFFDHGVDQTVKSTGTVFVPLKADDPLRTVGPDGIPGTGDEVPASLAFMVLTRAQNQPGADGKLGTADDVQDTNNTDTPWVDQSQTYASHSSHQLFLREYVLNAANHPVSTGRLLGGLAAGQTYLNSPDGTDGQATWASVKQQAAEKLGLRLHDTDVTNVPMMAMDPYGDFVPGPERGLPQYVTKTGLVEGDLAAPVPVPANVVYFDTPFLTDIAHNADPSAQDTDNNPSTPAVFPVADGDNTPSADFAHQPAGTYDDEMLNAHFACGDGRCNENIALSAVHQIFHSEHNRLVADIKNVLLTDTSATGTDALKEWQLPTSQSPDGWNGARLFQAARFITEMEYQHLVFEEFARKVVPAIRPFHVYSTDVNSAIDAEFAHAVYRFGHSMLDDDVARTNADGSDNSLPLLAAFLNPPEFFNNRGATYTPQQAAGAVVMGSVDQTGNELDEFIVETLRNNLLGLPLDLATLNLTRARDAGIPPLNDVRRQINAKTNDAALAPYKSWADFGQHLKHPESLVNFVAAYGLHPTITGATTLVAKRLAARAIVDPQPGDPTPADAAAFLFGTGAWASDAGGVTITGLDNVDLWVGGLAEATNLNGGLLGSTFNYVFQGQLEKLQDDDRFYYLNRTPGMNLRSQVEGNTFAELIERNTDNTNTLKADVFATADCKFQLGNISGPETVAVPGAHPATLLGAGTVHDDPSTPSCDENQLLLQQPDGTIQYRARNTIDRLGINGQSVYNGTPGVDRIFGGTDNDTFWGGAGNDVIEGAGGDDDVLGGDGNDIITDSGGLDVLRGGPGNDAQDAGPGNDFNIGGAGHDYLLGGANDNETFGGEGNDTIDAGQGADVVFGDGGDDWIQGGSGQDLLQGDHGAPFFDDPAELRPGNDIFIGQVGANDYTAEGGDDIMEQNPAIDRNAGAAGFDWAIHQLDTQAADDDIMINRNLAGLPVQLVANRDRWVETEADTGSDNFADIIRGQDLVPVVAAEAGFSGCDALDPAGVARIDGLDRYITTFPTDLAGVVATSAMKRCPLSGFGGGIGTGGVWAEGDILMGGGKSDLIEGRGNNDIIDGDRSLNVFLTVRTDPADPSTEIGRTDLMEHAAFAGGSFFNGAPSGPITLNEAVFAGRVDPGNIVPVREILDADHHKVTGPNPNNLSAPPESCTDTPTAGQPVPDLGLNQTTDNPSATANCDISEYSAAPANYTVTVNPNGSVTVVDLATAAGGGAALTGPAVRAGPDGTPRAHGGGGLVGIGDGTDTLWNIEALRFCDGTDPVTLKCNLWETSRVRDIAAGAAPTAALLGPSPIAFGTLTVGTDSLQAIIIVNTGGGVVNPTPATVTGPDFTIDSDNCFGAALSVGATCVIAVRFSPTATGPLTDALVVPTSANTVRVDLSGTGVAVTPAVATINGPASFGARRVGSLLTQQMTVRNTGGSPLHIASAASSSPRDFTVDLGTCAAAVGQNGTCLLSVTFNPLEPLGPKHATVTVVSDAGNTPTSVALNGTSRAAGVVVRALRILQPATPAAVKPVSVSLHVSTAASIRLQVRKTDGRFVWQRRINAKTAGTVRFRWNLRDSKGHRVKKGTYVFTIRVVDDTGFRVVVKRTVHVR